jgi:predicted aminopeptidase
MKASRPLAVAAALASLLLGGCGSIAYYAQAVSGHWDLIGRARPLDEVERDPATPEALRGRLALAQQIRAFASRALGLPDNGSYRRYADLGRPFAVWVVVSTAEFSVEPIEHCFPVAGCVSYRGYYAEADARREADAQRTRGRDAYVGGAPAYSTLGWFDDPLLSTFVGYPEAELARLVFHELAHQVAYARGDTEFNESFAMVVEEEGVRRWLEWRGAAASGTALAEYRAARERRAAFTALLLACRERLRALYAGSGSDAGKRAAKAAQFAALAADYARLKESWGGFAGYDRSMAAPDNALLASVAAYNGLVPALSARLRRHDGDLRAFYAEVRQLAALSREERRQRLAAGAAPPEQESSMPPWPSARQPRAEQQREHADDEQGDARPRQRPVAGHADQHRARHGAQRRAAEGGGVVEGHRSRPDGRIEGEQAYL